MAASNETFLAGDPLYSALADTLESCRKRVWIAQFLIDARPQEDRRGIVGHLLDLVAAAAARGADVRVLLPVVAGGSEPSWDANYAAAAYLSCYGVSVRRYCADAARPFMHAKALVGDSSAIFGSSNWTARAFTLNVEANIETRTTRAIAQATRWFERLWACAKCSIDGALTAPLLPFGSDGLRGATHVASRAADAFIRRQASARTEPTASAHAVGPPTAPTLVAGTRQIDSLRDAVGRSRSTVRIAAFGLGMVSTRRLHSLAAALVGATRRGVDVRVLYDARREFPNLWEPDSLALGALGVPMRPWPILSRMHARAAVVDDHHVLVGSGGLTARSAFRTEEASLVLSDSRVGATVASWFDESWAISTTEPTAWDIGILGEPRELVRKLRGAGVGTLGDLLAPNKQWAIVSNERLRIAARWVASERYAPAVAQVLGYAGVGGLRRWAGARDVRDIDDDLLRSTSEWPWLGRVPAATYLFRRLARKNV